MNLIKLKKIKNFCFGHEDISRVLRMKKNMYVLREAWNAAGREDKFLLANMGQVPSYISLMTALDYYEVTTQVQRDFFESVAVKRSKEINVDGSVFRYVKLATDLYNAFKKEKGVFIATPEKALLDAFYLMSYGRYSLDLSSLDAAKLDRRKIEHLSRKFPLKTKNMLKRYGYL
jgi:predicted transcriptional regulator of viral defense system